MELLLIKQPYPLCFVNNPVAFTLGVMPYGDNEKLQNIKIIARIEVEENYNSQVFTQAKEEAFYPDSDGTITFDIRTILKAFVEQYVPPVTQMIPSVCEDMVKRYRIVYRLLKDNNLVEGSVATSPALFILKGGISYQEWHPKKFFTEILATQKTFLRYAAAEEKVFANELKYLSWISGTDENSLQNVYVKIGYSDGTTSDDELLFSITAGPWQPCITPAGYNQLNLPDIADDTKTPVWYQLRVEVPCVAVQIASVTLPDATKNIAYAVSIALAGSVPFVLANIIKPSWMTIAISGSNVLLTGTPLGGDVDTDVPVSFDVTNCSGASDSFSDIIDVISPPCVPVVVTAAALPDGQVAVAYSSTLSLTGSAPFTLSSIVKPAWMSIAVSGSNVNITGTPGTGDDGTAITVSFTANNACGTDDFSDTIDVLPANGTHFLTSTFVSGNSSEVNEIANISGVPSTVTIKVTTYINTNGGSGVLVNGSNVFIDNTFTVVIDGSGIAHFNAKILGNAFSSGVILAVFTIFSVSAGTIGTPSTYQISKVF